LNEVTLATEAIDRDSMISTDETMKRLAKADFQALIKVKMRPKRIERRMRRHCRRWICRTHQDWMLFRFYWCWSFVCAFTG